MATKICKICFIEKNISNFHKRGITKKGNCIRGTACKECDKDRKHKEYLKRGKYTCECGAVVVSQYKTEHEKTKMHNEGAPCFACNKRKLKSKMTKYNDIYLCKCVLLKKRGRKTKEDKKKQQEIINNIINEPHVKTTSNVSLLD